MKIATRKPERLFRAVADVTRLRILNLLMGGELCVCDIVAVLDVPQPTASRHLAYLRKAGWVEGRKEGVWRYYRLSEASNSFEASLRKCLAECRDLMPKLAQDAAKLHRRPRCCD